MSNNQPTSRTLIRLKKQPKSEPTTSHFQFDHDSALPELQSGQVLIKALWISVDPYIRGRLYTTPKGTIMKSPQLAQVIASKSSSLKVGSIVSGEFEWSTYSIIDATPNTKNTIPFRVITDHAIDLSYHLGPLGLIGITAYQGLFDIGSLKKSDRVFVSGAAGAVGSIVGQIAKHAIGCTVIGVAGTDDKCKWLTEELGFDGALNYKKYNENVSKFRADLARKFDGKGIDLYFDNTGGFITQSVWDLLNFKGRVVVCGQIANYNRLTNVPKVPEFLHKTIYKHIRIEGFAINTFKRYPEFFRDMNQWIKDGKVKYRKTVFVGLDQVPHAFIGLFKGLNTGKMLVKISDPIKQSKL